MRFDAACCVMLCHRRQCCHGNTCTQHSCLLSLPVWHCQPEFGLCKQSFALTQVLDPLVAKAAALDACNALCAWLKPRQAHLFLPL